MNVNTKILIGFTLLIISIFSQLVVWYTLQVNILENTRQINDVESPMKTIAEQAFGYNAKMSEQVHLALLSAQKEDYSKVQFYQEQFNTIMLKQNDLLEKDAKILLSQSKRPLEMKLRVEKDLKELDRLNLLLENIRASSFSAIENRDIEMAYSLVVGGDYDVYENEFNENYKDWASVEDLMILSIRNNLFHESQRLIFSNLIFSIIIIIVLLVTIMLTRTYLTSYCLSRSRQ